MIRRMALAFTLALFLNIVATAMPASADEFLASGYIRSANAGNWARYAIYSSPSVRGFVWMRIWHANGVMTTGVDGITSTYMMMSFTDHTTRGHHWTLDYGGVDETSYWTQVQAGQIATPGGTAAEFLAFVASGGTSQMRLKYINDGGNYERWRQVSDNWVRNIFQPTSVNMAAIARLEAMYVAQGYDDGAPPAASNVPTQQQQQPRKRTGVLGIPMPGGH